MKTYYETAAGNFTIDGMSIPNDPANRHFQQMNVELADGDAEIIPYVYVPPTEEEQAALDDAANRQARVQPLPLTQALEVLSRGVDLTTLSDADLSAVASLYPIWRKVTEYAVDQNITHLNIVYRVVQAHTSQAGWEPPNVPAMFTPYRAEGSVTEWVQPTGAQDSYALGDKVTHNGLTWESTAADNVWEPGVYGWVEI